MENQTQKQISPSFPLMLIDGIVIIFLAFLIWGFIFWIKPIHYFKTHFSHLPFPTVSKEFLSKLW